MRTQGQIKITLLHIIKIRHSQKQIHDNPARNMFGIWNHTMFQSGSFEVFWEADINSKYQKFSRCKKLILTTLFIKLSIYIAPVDTKPNFYWKEAKFIGSST